MGGKLPQYAIMSHIYANILYYAKSVVQGGPELLDEARTVIRNSIDLSMESASRIPADPVATCTSTGQPTLRLVAVATAARSELDRLKLAAATAGLQLDVLGMGQPWEGLGSKITF